MLKIINYWNVYSWKGHLDNISHLGRETGPGVEQYLEFSLEMHALKPFSFCTSYSLFIVSRTLDR